MTWWEYVTRTAPGTREQIARRIEVSQATVSRWRNSTPDPRNVAAFARAYDRPVLEAFVAAGFLSADEAGQPPSSALDVRQLDDDELLAEVERRIKRGGHDGRQPEAEKNRGDNGGSGGGGVRSSSGKRRRGITGHGRPDDGAPSET